MDKNEIVQALRAQLIEQADTMQRAADAARENATHEESKPENEKDTRALEASYLAGAQAAKAREIKAALNALSFMSLRDLFLVTIERDGRKSTYFIAPYAGGLKVGNVTVITPSSPMGAALVGRKAGETVEIGGKEAEVLSVQ